MCWWCVCVRAPHSSSKEGGACARAPTNTYTMGFGLARGGLPCPHPRLPSASSGAAAAPDEAGVSPCLPSASSGAAAATDEAGDGERGTGNGEGLGVEGLGLGFRV